MKPDARNPLRELAGSLPPLEPLAGEEEAWRRLSAAMNAPEKKREAPRLFWLVACGAAAVAALLLRPSRPSSAGAPNGAQPVAAAPAHRPMPDARSPPAFAATTQPEAGAPGEGSLVRTGPREARLALPGGSVALLERSSAAHLARLAPGRVELALDSGAVFVRVPKLGAGSLAVRAGRWRVIVHGTAFRVERRDGRISVALWHGSVEIRADGQAAGFLLQPGQKVRFGEDRGPQAANVRPLGDAASRGADEEARLERPARANAVPPASVVPPSPPPPFVVADLARCRSEAGGERPQGPLRLDLTLADDGRVLQASLERGDANPPLASCVAEAALHWKLDPPPPLLRGLQFVFAVPLN